MNLSELNELNKLAERRMILISQIKDIFNARHNLTIRDQHGNILSSSSGMTMTSMEYCDLLTRGMRDEIKRTEEILTSSGVVIDSIVDEKV